MGAVAAAHVPLIRERQRMIFRREGGAVAAAHVPLIRERQSMIFRREGGAVAAAHVPLIRERQSMIFRREGGAVAAAHVHLCEQGEGRRGGGVMGAMQRVYLEHAQCAGLAQRICKALASAAILSHNLHNLVVPRG